MQLVDTHTHLYSSEFDEDLEAVVGRALDQGVAHFLLPNVDAESFPKMMALVERWPNCCHAMMGLHPTQVGEDPGADLQLVYNQLKKGGFVAVGEIGVDLYWDKTFKQQQMDAFATQLQWAVEFDLPVAIHVRDAFDEVFEVLEQERNDKLRGVFHCFTGTEEQGHRAIDMGFMLGIGGVLTFKKAGLDKAVAAFDLKHLLLETDSPYLAPTPKRGKRNESAYLLHIANKLAEVKGVGIGEVAQVTTQNARSLFGLGKLIG